MADSARATGAVRGAVWAARLALAATLLAAVGALAHVPLGEPDREGALRIDLRTQRAKVEICAERDAAELAALPAHMRQARDCRETAVDYRLRVSVDGVARVDRRLGHRGVRRNRPLVAGELVRLEPGARAVEVELAPIPPEGALGDAATAIAALPTYRFAERLEIVAGRVEIVSLEGATLRRLPPL